MLISCNDMMMKQGRDFSETMKKTEEKLYTVCGLK